MTKSERENDLCMASANPYIRLPFSLVDERERGKCNEKIGDKNNSKGRTG